MLSLKLRFESTTIPRYLKLGTTSTGDSTSTFIVTALNGSVSFLLSNTSSFLFETLENLKKKLLDYFRSGHKQPGPYCQRTSQGLARCRYIPLHQCIQRTIRVEERIPVERSIHSHLFTHCSIEDDSAARELSSPEDDAVVSIEIKKSLIRR